MGFHSRRSRHCWIYWDAREYAQHLFLLESNLRIRTIVECQINRLVARMRQTPYGNIIVRPIEKKPERSDEGERS
jgi:hypothetical protein